MNLWARRRPAGGSGRFGSLAFSIGPEIFDSEAEQPDLTHSRFPRPELIVSFSGEGKKIIGKVAEAFITSNPIGMNQKHYSPRQPLEFAGIVCGKTGGQRLPDFPLKFGIFYGSKGLPDLVMSERAFVFS